MKNININRKQKELWLNNLVNDDLIYFHVFGNNKKCNNKKYLFNEKDKILYVNTKDDYVSLPSKVIQAFYAINNKYNYDYIFKTDDDQELIIDTFFNKIINIIEYKKYKLWRFIITC